MTQPRNPGSVPKRKKSEMIAEMAAGFLGVGDTIEDRQNRLSDAFTAWNNRERLPHRNRVGDIAVTAAGLTLACLTMLTDLKIGNIKVAACRCPRA
jgi:hypothetical protein